MANKMPYGDVTYADPGYQADKKKRYPLDTEAHAKAAWSYINMSKNASAYSSSQLSSIKGKIKSALKRFGVQTSDDSQNSAPPEGETRSYPTDDLIRMSEPPGIKNGRTLYGTVIPYDSPAEIRSWEGHFIERIKPGAAAKTIQDQGTRARVLFNHGMDPSIGEKPLGKWTVLEDRADGVYAEVPVADTSYGDDILALVEAGAIDGWSFRFSVPKGKETWTRPSERGALPQRDVHEIRMPEFGPVTYPAYEASTLGVRSNHEFSIWQQLPQSQRAKLEEMFMQSMDLSTSMESLRDATDIEAADDTTVEPNNADDAALEDDMVADVVDEESEGERTHSAVSHSERQRYVRRMRAAELLRR